MNWIFWKRSISIMLYRSVPDCKTSMDLFGTDLYQIPPCCLQTNVMFWFLLFIESFLCALRFKYLAYIFAPNLMLGNENES